jgi:diguanylate cyclase (GGDEF)-like protein
MSGLASAMSTITAWTGVPNQRPTEAFLICTQDSQVVYASKGLAVLLQLDSDQFAHPGAVRNQQLLPLLAASAVIDPPAQAAIASRFAQARLAQADCSLDFLSAAGELQPIHLQIQPVGEAHWILSFEDLGARRAAENDVAKLAFTDALTGLGNRLRFRQSLALALGERAVDAPRLALLLIDLDRFKAVNDTLGHPVGDQLLRKVAERLHTVIRQKDMLARLGGDEFAIWLPSAADDSDALARLGARIVDLLGRPFLIEGQQVNIGASVGIAVAPPDGSDYESLMKSADLALYSAKSAGRGFFHFFDSAMEHRAQDRRRLELDLRRALALRQFELHYRPQVDVETRNLFGLEALLRWHHPERGLLEPAGFLPLAEEIALLVPIGRWMLEVACRQAASWPANIKLVLAVSTPQFESGSLVDAVKQALAASGLDPSRLELEITERVLLSNEAFVVKTLYELRALGVRIGISNFGTGYASLTKLDSFPFDRIKMDTSLVEGEIVSHRAIVSAVVAFGASLGVSTLVDGIRTEEQLAKLRADGGRAVRGFLFVPTVSPVELEGLFSRAAATG